MDKNIQMPLTIDKMINLLIVFCFALLVVFSSLFVAYFGKVWNLKPWVAIGSGALLSICFFDFLPHAFGEDSYSHETISAFILAGILAQFLADIYLLPRLGFLDKLLKTKEPHPSHTHSHTLSPSSVCSVVGCLSLCSFFDGVRLFSALAIEGLVALETAFALFFHLLSEGALVAILALSSGIKKRVLFVLVFCVAGALVFGALFAQLFLLSLSSDMLIAFSSGILIYICFSHLLPFCLKHNNSSWLFVGLLLFSLLNFLI